MGEEPARVRGPGAAGVIFHPRSSAVARRPYGSSSWPRHRPIWSTTPWTRKPTASIRSSACGRSRPATCRSGPPGRRRPSCSACALIGAGLLSGPSSRASSALRGHQPRLLPRPKARPGDRDGLCRIWVRAEGGGGRSRRPCPALALVPARHLLRCPVHRGRQTELGAQVLGDDRAGHRAALGQYPASFLRVVRVSRRPSP